MPISLAMRSASLRASSAHSSRVIPLTGTSGHTSVAPMRGCAPWWWRMSITSPAFLTALKAASTTASGSPTNVTTVRLVASPGSTSNSFTPSLFSITSVICLITVLSRPSLKLGTHSTICLVFAIVFSKYIKLCVVVNANVSRRCMQRRPYMSVFLTCKDSVFTYKLQEM